jgi:hypothetical protein
VRGTINQWATVDGLPVISSEKTTKMQLSEHVRPLGRGRRIEAVTRQSVVFMLLTTVPGPLTSSTKMLTCVGIQCWPDSPIIPLRERFTEAEVRSNDPGKTTH